MSRANDQICREEVATCPTQADRNTLRSVVEDLYHGLSRWSIKYAVQIAQAENECNAHGEEHDRVKSDGTSDYQWDRQ